jgi:hypothetical protein
VRSNRPTVEGGGGTTFDITVVVTHGPPYHRRVLTTVITLRTNSMSRSSASHDTLSRQPRWRRVAQPSLQHSSAEPLADTHHSLGERCAND